METLKKKSNKEVLNEEKDLVKKEIEMKNKDIEQYKKDLKDIAQWKEASWQEGFAATDGLQVMIWSFYIILPSSVCIFLTLIYIPPDLHD